MDWQTVLSIGALILAGMTLLSRTFDKSLSIREHEDEVRAEVWRNAITLIAMHPWSGVGFGEFNLAWTLSPFPERSPQFFDHTHNLPLQLAVELGLPLAALVTGLLLWALLSRH